MSKEIDWSKAPADATHYQAATHGVFECWLKPGHAVRVSRREPDWREDDYADDLIATSAIKRPWSGEGLPPVGVVCMANGYQVVIVAHHCNGIHAIYAESEVDGLLYYGEPNEFRPIRTIEQIEADQREAQIVAIHDAIVTSVKVTLGQCDSWRKVAEMVYDAGFKRPE